MNTTIDPLNPSLQPGAELHGFRIERIEPLAEIQAVFYALTHIKTGARYVHISRDEKENTFSVAFKTVPTDSTGVAHILEHTVLCGSKKFPVRDPFFSMLKRSLSTFMNAFTASDWTMYPFSTENRKDFYNLMDVYLDATFYPNLDVLSFKQEGHRWELEPDPQDAATKALVYKGVVYNEMKGAMSAPDQILARSLQSALYPDTTYSCNSGGEPADIPNLTHEQLVAFHKRHYHPSNAFFYTYGDIPLADHLAVIEDKILQHFDRIDPQTDVPNQTRWTSPRTQTESYPLAKNEAPDKKHQVSLAWLTADIKDTREVLVLVLLEQVLLGNAASPLRKALIDSSLGTSLSDTVGYGPDNRDTFFVAGLKDVKAADADRIEAIIMGVLNELAQNGIDKELIESAIHQIEFHRKEVTNTPYPYGIKLLLAFSGSWFHGGDPLRTLQLDEDLEFIRNACAKGPFFEEKIKTYLIDNPHRVRFLLQPDHQMAAKEAKRVAAELAQTHQKLSEDQIAAIEEQAALLAKLQDSQEDVSSLPTLQLADIPPQIKTTRPDNVDADHALNTYNKATSGIFYYSSAAGAGGIDNELVPLVPFFCHAFSRVGTARRDYVAMAQQIDRYTGGIGLAAQARTQFVDGGTCLPFITFGGKCLVRNLDAMFGIFKEMIFQIDFTDLERLKSLLLEFRAGIESMVVHNGHRLAMSLAARRFTPAAALGEIWGGVTQLQTIKQVTEDLSEAKLKVLADQLHTINSQIFAGGNLKMALIGEPQALDTAARHSRAMQQQLGPNGTHGFKALPTDLGGDLPWEGWSTATAVSFVANAFETVRMQHADAAALAVAAKMLRSMYLHREIREKGGAYGGFAIYNPEDGLFLYGSYRDPHIVATMDTYSAAADFIRSGNYTDEDIKEAVLQVCSDIDKPDPPGPEARKSFYRDLLGLTDEIRKTFKSNLLAMTRAKVMDTARAYFDKGNPRQATAVISNEEKIAAANAKLGDRALTPHTI